MASREFLKDNSFDGFVMGLGRRFIVDTVEPVDHNDLVEGRRPAASMGGVAIAPELIGVEAELLPADSDN